MPSKIVFKKLLIKEFMHFGIFRFMPLRWITIITIFIIIPSFIRSALAPKIDTQLGLAKQEQLYQKYFMDSQNATREEVWTNFLSQPTGVTEKKRATEVIISLVSYPSIITTTWLSIESLLRQENKPDLIILNLAEHDFPNKSLPAPLHYQMKRGLEIKWHSNQNTMNRSFTRSDVLHPSRLINYFQSHFLNELVIIPYNAHVSLSPLYKNRLNYKESDGLFFEDASSQFKSLGGTFHMLSTEAFSSERVYNPSIIRFNNKTFMTFRVQDHVYNKKMPQFYAETFFAELDNNYTIKNSYSLIKDVSIKHEDARLTTKGDSLFVSYVSATWELLPSRYRAYIETASFELNQRINNPVRPDIASNKAFDCMEKNWLFFEKDKRFLIINHIDPLEVWDGTHDLENPILICKKPKKIHDWNYGEIRASTTPLYLDEYKLWLVFFHSNLRTLDHVRIYFIGALVFDNDFNITGYTDKPLLVPTPHQKPLIDANTILPFGCIRENDNLILSLGINDSKSAIGKLPLNRVMHALKYIS